MSKVEENDQSVPIQTVANADDANEAHIVALQVQGMGCANCGARVRSNLRALDGVVSADVDWEHGIALVDYVPTKTNVDAIIRAVATAGDNARHIYRARVIG